MAKKEYIAPISVLIELDTPLMQDFASGWGTDGNHQGDVVEDEGDLEWGKND